MAVLIAVCSYCVVSGQVMRKVQEEKCGFQRASLKSRIFGEPKLDEEEFDSPWLVGLLYINGETLFCAGSLISAKHVLSGKTQTFDLLAFSEINKCLRVNHEFLSFQRRIVFNKMES